MSVIPNAQKEPITGKMQKTDNTVVNVADVLADVYDAANHVLKTSGSGGSDGGGAATEADGANVTLGAKADAAATVGDTTPFSAIALLKGIWNKLIAGTAANTARANTAIVIPTQPIDAAGNVLGRTAANTARTTGTLVDPVQIVDAAGNVLGRTAANTARTTGTLVDPVQIVDAAGNVLPVNPVLGASTNVIGRVGAKPFKILQTFTRPSDGNAYTADDAITNSTSAPAIMSQDLAAAGAVVGQFIAITNARVISNVKGASIDLSANIWLMPVTFAATNDNAALSLDDTTAALGGLVIPCWNPFRNAANHRTVSDPGYWEMQLAAADTNVFFTVQAANGYTPTTGEIFTVVLQGVLL